MARVEAAAASPQRAVLPQHAQLRPPQSALDSPGKIQGRKNKLRRPVAPYRRPARAGIGYDAAQAAPLVQQEIQFPAVPAPEIGVPQMELHMINGQQVFVGIPQVGNP